MFSLFGYVKVRLSQIVVIAPTTQGVDGGNVVSLLAFYSNDPSSNPPDAYSFICKICVWKDIK